MAKRVTKDDFDQIVLNNSLPVVVDFYSDSCVACKKLAPALGDLEDNYEGKIEVVKVNTNFDSELCEKYRIMANPSVLLFHEGKEAARKTGALSYKELEDFVVSHI